MKKLPGIVGNCGNFLFKLRLYKALLEQILSHICFLPSSGIFFHAFFKHGRVEIDKRTINHTPVSNEACDGVDVFFFHVK